MPCHIAIDTKCNVCEESPADTFYMERPMCYACRENVEHQFLRPESEDNDGPYWKAEEITILDNDDRFQEYDDHMSDLEADADTLRSCGWGTDEDYGG